MVGIISLAGRSGLLKENIMTTVVLCGSARFETQFKEASKQLGLMGIVVIGLSSYPSENEDNKKWYRPDEKEMLDLVHLEKIRLADAVLVIDGVPTFDSDSSHDPYIGFSTAREILWARMQNRPMLSLLSSNGWGDIRILLDNLYDQDLLRNHSWLSGHASHVLRINTGVDVVSDMIDHDKLAILHAGMSVLACNGEEASTSFATKTLEIAGLDPVSDMPALMPMFQDPPAGSGNVDTEPMVTLERRRLVGTVIMMRAVGNMLTQRKPKLSRDDAVEKLDMAVKTCIDSFGLNHNEIDEALSTNQD